MNEVIYKVVIPERRFKTLMEVPSKLSYTKKGELLDDTYDSLMMGSYADSMNLGDRLVKSYRKEGKASLSSIEKELEAFCKKMIAFEDNLSEYASARVEEFHCMYGVYIFFSKKGTILYVGQSKQLKNRLSQHINGASSGHIGLNLVYDTFTFIPMESEKEMDFVEMLLINELKPRLNTQMVKYHKEHASDCGDSELVDKTVEHAKNPIKDQHKKLLNNLCKEAISEEEFTKEVARLEVYRDELQKLGILVD